VGFTSDAVNLDCFFPTLTVTLAVSSPVTSPVLVTSHVIAVLSDSDPTLQCLHVVIREASVLLQLYSQLWASS
jgi:hypothetical protein